MKLLPLWHIIIIKRVDFKNSAYVPDLPGCIATGVTVEETENEVCEAIVFHLDGIRENGLPISEPSSVYKYVEV